MIYGFFESTQAATRELQLAALAKAEPAIGMGEEKGHDRALDK
jgi:hypothetical protein